MIRPQLLPPANWQDFETFCLAIWQDIWGDITAQKHGRQGQAQAGVDVFGRVPHSTGWHGVQCKLKDVRDGELTLQEIVDEVAKAESFAPKLHSFTVATTIKRDTALQKAVRQLSEARFTRGDFAVHVYSWDDIVDVLAIRPTLIRKLYPEIFAQFGEPLTGQDGSIACRISPTSDTILECQSIFESDSVRTLIAEELRIELRNVVTEMVLNAFEHGIARRCDISLSENSITIEDDGRPFDPVAPTPSSPTGAGLLYLHHFLQKRAAELTCNYTRSGDKNVLVLTATRPWSSRDFLRTCAVMLKDRYSGGPIRASHADFPEGCDEYHFSVPLGVFNPSSLMEFLMGILGILPPAARLRVRFNKGDLLESIVRYAVSTGWLNPARLVIEAQDG